MSKVDESFPELVEYLRTYDVDTYGRPRFRLIWSEDAFEVRHGTFCDFSDDGLFIREVTESRQVRKYNYIFERWILEFLAPGFVSLELPEARSGSYEPVYVFQDKKGNYLAPNRKVLDLILFFANGKERPMSKEERQEMFDRMKDKEVQEFMDRIDSSPLQNALHSREAIGYTKEISHA